MSASPPHIIRRFKELNTALRLGGIKAWVTPSDKGVWQQRLDLAGETPVSVLAGVIQAQVQRMGDCRVIRMYHTEQHVLWNIWEDCPVPATAQPTTWDITFRTAPE